MLSILKDKRFRHLYFAQILALHGTGLASIALALMAFDLTGQNAALLLSSIFTIKMLAYVVVSPIAGAIAHKFNRKLYLIILDIIRALSALALFFVTDIWQIYIIILFLQVSSAAFTPIYQATIPEILPDEDEYTRALSLSRIAYDIENIISAGVAGLILVSFSYNILFLGTVFGFLGSAVLLSSIILPKFADIKDQNFLQNITYGLKKFTKYPRLKGLFFINIVIASCGSMIIINTIIFVRFDLSLSEISFPITMLAFGIGSILAALSVPKLLTIISDKKLMLIGSFAIVLSFYALALWIKFYDISWSALIITWLISGISYSCVLTPAGRIIRKSSNGSDFSQLYAAQFSLSHLCWLMMYPFSGWVMTRHGSFISLIAIGTIILLSTFVAYHTWKHDKIY